MRHINETEREELTKFWAVVTVLRGLDSNHTRGPYLVAELKKNPRLRAYFRVVYDAAWKFPFTSVEAYAADTSRPDDGNGFPGVFRVLKEVMTGAGEGYWVGYTRSLPKELVEIVNSLLDKDLRCGVTGPLFNRALEKAGLETINLPPDAPPPSAPRPRNRKEITLEVNSGLNGIYTGVLAVGGNRAANVALYQGTALTTLIETLRAAGVVVVVPNYIEGMP